MRSVARIASPVIAFILAYLLLQGFGPTKALVGATFAATVILWITELMPLAVTALLSTSALVLVAGVKDKEAFAAYGDPIIPLFIGSFLLARAMELSGLSDRFAYQMMRMRWANSPAGLLLALAVVGCSLSLLISNTAVTAMMLPIGLSVLSTVERRSQTPYAVAVMLTLTWASSVAVGIPVGTPPNLIGRGLIEKATNVRISTLQWMGFAMPITIVVLLVSWGILWVMFGKGAPKTEAAGTEARTRLREMGPMRQSEKVVLLSFCLALFLWILPSLAEMVFDKKAPATLWLQGRVTEAVAALVAASLLFLLPAKDRPSGRALTWTEGTQIEWGTILLFGGGIALGQALFSSGLAKDLGDIAARASGAHSLWSITALCIAASIILSELASNTAAATTLVPVAIGLAQGAHVSPIAPALGAAIGASFGFMLPVSTAPNAIVYSSGLVPAKDMMRAGILLDVVGFVSIFVCLRIFLPMLGLA
ncbi:SLC13 family permease [Fimbriimonas ginsengisoli]|uniref:Sodium-dependent dicarboxylate transporter SdcS n=1 Tax=Fimbriimonas ginsengisoli Gsoil 348 TaxID=661478 RepID=A0A068NWQ8_FIMGI|nr:DASS family sodium-coupled anion symporter [Fimbriimonas ginsengisoli]AIE87953.1 Anion transporter [Fimbriimonas ginsengisoli Gsoil 348]